MPPASRITSRPLRLSRISAISAPSLPTSSDSSRSTLRRLRSYRMRLLILSALVLLAVVPILAAPPKEKKARKKPRPTEPPPPPPEPEYVVEAPQDPVPDLSNYDDLLNYDTELLAEPKDEAGLLIPKTEAQPKAPVTEKPKTAPPPAAGGAGGPGLFGQEAPIGLPTCLLCVCLRGSVYCDDNDLDAIPSLPRDTSYFYARYNRIGTVRLADFQGLTRLKRIDLSNNEVTSVETGALVGLVALEELNLGSNRLTAIPALPSSLRQLDLQHNQLVNSGLPVDVFRDMNLLTYLYLGNNHLDHIPVPFPISLRVLHLQYNNVQEIRDDTFCSTKHPIMRRVLEDIRLDGNPVNLSRTPNAYVCLPRLPTGRTY
ncbi:LOW QUALITY PROTEIN: epiphycan-like [Lampetra planeri]